MTIVKAMLLAGNDTVFGVMTAPVAAHCIHSGPSGPSPVGTRAGTRRERCCIAGFAGHVRGPAYSTCLRLGQPVVFRGKF